MQLNTLARAVFQTLMTAIPERWQPVGYLISLTQTLSGCTVRTGPFKGMQYVSDSIGSVYIPKLLGIYEKELAGVVEAACALGVRSIINIGAGEGYYAIGMALRNPKATVVAFEMDVRGRDLLAKMGKMNGVADRVRIEGVCRSSDLLDTTMDCDGMTLIICDVEGAEKELLRASNIHSLVSTWILVEVHNFVCPGITECLTKEFSSTHRITEIWQEEREASDFPYRTWGTRMLPSKYLRSAVSEWRPERMSWLWIEPR